MVSPGESPQIQLICIMYVYVLTRALHMHQSVAHSDLRQYSFCMNNLICLLVFTILHILYISLKFSLPNIDQLFTRLYKNETYNRPYRTHHQTIRSLSRSNTNKLMSRRSFYPLKKITNGTKNLSCIIK
jgi:hypothetical protein